MIVTARSPDGQISATVQGRDRVRLAFEPDAYRWYDESNLAHQLGQLATLTWVAYRRTYFELLSEAVGEAVRGPAPAHGHRESAFREGLEQLTMQARSAGGWVFVHSQALVRWRVEVGPGACRRLPEQEFLAEVDQALRAVLTDYYEQVRRLKDEHFDLKLPADRDRR
jgi:hypothetical protein